LVEQSLPGVAHPNIRLALWLVAFVLLVTIFYLTHRLVVIHIGPNKEDVDIFVKLPQVLTVIGMLWALMLLVFGYMVAALKG
jgi:hypothetical protein